MAAAIRMTQMPMVGTGTGARPWSCASAYHASAGSHPSYTGEFAVKAGAVEQDAFRLLIDATVRPKGTPGGSTG